MDRIQKGVKTHGRTLSQALPKAPRKKEKLHSSLLKINQRLISQQISPHFLQYVLKQATNLLQVNAAALILWDEAICSLLPVNISREYSYVKGDFEKKDFTSLLSAPIKGENKILGALSFYTKNKRNFTSSEIDIAKILASQLTLAILNRVYIEKNKKIATIEKVTGLYNQSYFYQRLEEEIARASRSKVNLSILFMDTDRLKDINDTYGHLMGDRVIQVIAQSIKSSIRKMDIPFRYGGDEFVIILPQASSQEAFLIAERIRQNIKKEAPFPPVSLSFGIASFPQHAQETRKLLDEADRAMYQAKQKGGDRIEKVYSQKIRQGEENV